MARSYMDGLAHGLRARRHAADPALGEDPAEAAAHARAVREELDAAGPVARRHLAETVARAVLRAARAERLEGELPAPSEPRTEKIVPVQLIAPAARDPGADTGPLPRRPERARTLRRRKLTEAEREAMAAAAREQAAAKAEGRDPHTVRAKVDQVLLAGQPPVRQPYARLSGYGSGGAG